MCDCAHAALQAFRDWRRQEEQECHVLRKQKSGQGSGPDGYLACASCWTHSSMPVLQLELLPGYVHRLVWNRPWKKSVRCPLLCIAWNICSLQGMSHELPRNTVACAARQRNQSWG